MQIERDEGWAKGEDADNFGWVHFAPVKVKPLIWIKMIDRKL